MINLIDNAIPNDVLHGAIIRAEQSKCYTLLHGAGMSRDMFKYNWMLFDERNGVQFEDEELLRLWDEVKPHTPPNTKLHRAYINAHTFGVEDTIHVDDIEFKNGYTVIVYLCNDWYAEWGGMTCTYSGQAANALDITAAVVPRRNRMIIFDKNIPHMVTPLSKRFTGVRLTCMFKLETGNENAA
jgi:Rps23 Pro-64 3,4-dihydroxylase Tpa1-like proline 4-hydroxylase